MNLPSKFRETCRVGRLKLSRPSREEVCADISGSNEIKFRISAQIEKHIDHMRVHYSVLPQPDHPSRKSLEPAVMTGNCRLSLACAWQSFLRELRAALGRVYRHRLHRAPAQHHAAAQALRAVEAVFEVVGAPPQTVAVLIARDTQAAQGDGLVEQLRVDFRTGPASDLEGVCSCTPTVVPKPYY